MVIWISVRLIVPKFFDNSVLKFLQPDGRLEASEVSVKTDGGLQGPML
jgi:hypothetical protein